MDNIEKCAICLENITEKNIVILECGHKFDICCYTKYVIHKVKDIVNLARDDEIKCPMCRKVDVSMLIPLLQTFQDNMDSEVRYSFLITDVEDLLIKQVFPHLASILHGGHRFTKDSLITTLQRTLKSSRKDLKDLIRDHRSS